MHRLVVSLALVAVLSLGSCTSRTVSKGSSGALGSGQMASRDYQETGFSALDVDSAFVVKVTEGSAYRVTVSIDDNLFDYVRVSQEQGTLRIALDTSGTGSFQSTRQEATVTMPAVSAVRVNGASQVSLAGFGPVTSFEANVDGASQLSGEVQATNITLTANGESQLELEGIGNSLTLTLDGAAGADLLQLQVESADVTLNGGSQAQVAAATSLDYTVNSGSRLIYAGEPIVGRDSVGGGSRVRQQ